jgi:hypothetical protein
MFKNVGQSKKILQRNSNKIDLSENPLIFNEIGHQLFSALMKSSENI